MIRRIALILAVTLLAVAWFSSCDNCNDGPSMPPTGLSVIEGTLLIHGASAESVLVVVRSLYRSDVWAMTEALTDSAGGFRLEIPPGEYMLGLDSDYYSGDLVYADGNLQHRDVEPGVIEAGDEPLRIDLEAGAASVVLQTPAELDSSYLMVQLRQEGDEALDFHVLARALGGVLHAEFPILPFGSYTVHADVYNQILDLPTRLDPSAADSIQVSPNLKGSGEYMIPAPIRVSGAVTGSWQSLVPDHNPRVSLFQADSTWLLNAYCDDDGYFEVTLATPDPFRASVEINDASRWIGGNSFEDATLFGADPGGTIEDVSLIESGIACRVSGPVEGDLVYAECMVYSEDGRPVFPESYLDDTAGLLRIPNLVPGAYYLHLQRHRYSSFATWCPQWHSQAEMIEEATPILIQDQGEVVQISVSLMEGATISGKILRSSGEIAGGVAVIAERIGYTGGDLEPVSRAETTELDGYFEIKGLPNGQYIVGVVLSWWTDDVWWYPGKLEPAAADTVLIRDFRSVTGLDWQMPI